jgi:hypothetical protein
MSIDPIEHGSALKLFVVGESSPDPKTWSQDCWLVAAEDADEARRMVERPGAEICEIPVETPPRVGSTTLPPDPYFGENL